MPVPNNNPLFTATPVVTFNSIPNTFAVPRSDGYSAGLGIDVLTAAFTGGSNGSYIDTIRWTCVASGATNSVATVLRTYISTVPVPGMTTDQNTFLFSEVGVPIIAASNGTNAANYYDVPVGRAIGSGQYLHISQHTAQTTNLNWGAIIFGGNY